VLNPHVVRAVQETGVEIAEKLARMRAVRAAVHRQIEGMDAIGWLRKG
jgi:hypothetical protein